MAWRCCSYPAVLLSKPWQLAVAVLPVPLSAKACCSKQAGEYLIVVFYCAMALEVPPPSTTKEVPARQQQQQEEGQWKQWHLQEARSAV
jgi:hypothetical protein